MRDIREGLLYGGLPYRAAGAGPPVVVFRGIEVDNADPSGQSRRRNMRVFRSLTRHFTVTSSTPSHIWHLDRPCTTWPDTTPRPSAGSSTRRCTSSGGVHRRVHRAGLRRRPPAPAQPAGSALQRLPALPVRPAGPATIRRPDPSRPAPRGVGHHRAGAGRHHHRWRVVVVGEHRADRDGLVRLEFGGERDTDLGTRIPNIGEGQP